MEAVNRFGKRFILLGKEKYQGLGFDYLDIYNVYSKAFAVRRNSIDETLFKQILMEECYQPNLWFNRNLREQFVLKNVRCILDIGANIGLASCYFANLYKDANIYSFEADEENYKLLKRNTEDYRNIRTFHAAVWKNEQGVYIKNRNDIYGHSGKANPAKYMVGDQMVENEKRIDSVKISDLKEKLQINTIDILKMDIQGAEIEAFEDSQRWLPYVRLLFIETHDLFRNGCSRKVFGELAVNGQFKFIGCPDREILAFLREDEV